MQLYYFKFFRGDYSYSFQASSELTNVTVTVSLVSSRTRLQEIIPQGFPQELLQSQLHDLMGFDFDSIFPAGPGPGLQIPETRL